MELEKAQKLAEEIMGCLRPFCMKIEVAGSIRRKKPLVRDVDIVLIASDPWELHRKAMDLGLVRMAGGKALRVDVNGTQVDIYVASPETWATLLLIRTGSAQNNIRLSSLAKKRGWKLCADGRGLFNEKGERIAGDSEQSIYHLLQIPWQEPWERR